MHFCRLPLVLAGNVACLPRPLHLDAGPLPLPPLQEVTSLEAQLEVQQDIATQVSAELEAVKCMVSQAVCG